MSVNSNPTGPRGRLFNLWIHGHCLKGITMRHAYFMACHHFWPSEGLVPPRSNRKGNLVGAIFHEVQHELNEARSRSDRGRSG